MTNYRTIKELSQYLGVTTQTIRTWLKEGKIPKHDTEENGRKLWSPQAAAVALDYRMKNFASTKREQRRLIQR